MTVGVCHFPEHWPRPDLARALGSDRRSDAGVDRTPRPSERGRLSRRGDLPWVTNFAPGAERVAGVVTAPPHELTVERTG